MLPLLLSALLVLAPRAVQAGGGQERQSRARLAEAERLIEQRDYDQAILLLTRVAKEDPSAFDAAQRLMERIRSVRGQYNQLYADLIAALEENDLGRALELIRELSALDPNPNDAAARSLRLAREGAELTYNLSELDRIMNESGQLIAQGRYVEAVQKCLGGFTLYREAFDRADYGNIVRNAVTGALETVRQAADGLSGRLRSLEEAAAALEEELQAGVPPDLEERARELREGLTELMGLAKTTRRAADALAAQNRAIRSGEAGKYDRFLFFAGQLITGRDSAEAPEGILAAMTGAWEAREEAISGVLTRSAERRYQAAAASWHSREAESGEQLAQTARLYQAALDIQTLWEMRLQTDPFRLEGGNLVILHRELPALLELQDRLRQISTYRQLSASRAEAERLATMQPETTAEVDQMRASLGQALDQARSLAGEWEATRLEDLSRFGIETAGREARSAEMAAVVERVVAELERQDLVLFQQLAAEELPDLETEMQRIAAGYRQGLEVEQGRSEGQAEAALRPFPARALEIYRPLAQDAQNLLERIQQLGVKLGGSTDRPSRSPAIVSSLNRLAALRESVQNLQKELAASVARAQQAALQAESYRQEGLLRLQEARNAIAARRYETARSKLQDAQEALDRSLELQEDPDVRELRDRELTALDRRIKDAENQLVVEDVRRLIEQGKSLFNQQEFIQAEQVLLRAQARWADTNPEENREVSLWLQFVRNALQATTGRQIAVADPLYTAMSQLYNLAEQEFQEGKRLIAQNNVVEGLRVLQRSADRLEQIRKFYPNNLDIRILSLRIEEVRDPDRYAELLRQMFAAARSKIDSGTPQEHQNALADLQAIMEFNPDYPGLKEAVASLEIKLGLRLPPPDPAKIASAQRSYEQALEIWQRRQTDLYPAAVDLLNQALQDNPQFSRAGTLKDQILLAVGGQKQEFLSSDSMRALREAEALFLDGKYFQALGIVDRLLQDRRNQGYPPLLDLKRRIEARI